jgi:hypothetical protein
MDATINYAGFEIGISHIGGNFNYGIFHIVVNWNGTIIYNNEKYCYDYLGFGFTYGAVAREVIDRNNAYFCKKVAELRNN